MHLTKEEIANVVKKHAGSAKNTGNTDAQIALYTERILHLTEHLKINKKDKATERSLVLMVGRRKSLLDYIKNKDIAKYRTLIKELNIRK
jgi:small subunit ribosomal protein S15